MSSGGTEAYRGSLELPPLVRRAVQAALEHGFAFSCLPSHGRLLQLLAGGIADGVIGETGTGCGVGLAWLASGARHGTRLVSIDHDEQLVAIARAVFADVPAVQVVHGDWHDLRREGPFDLLALDGGGQGKHGEAQIEPQDWLNPAGTVVIDDFTPGAGWPPTYNGTPDRARLAWLRHPALLAAEIRTQLDAATIVATFPGRKRAYPTSRGGTHAEAVVNGPHHRGSVTAVGGERRRRPAMTVMTAMPAVTSSSHSDHGPL